MKRIIAFMAAFALMILGGCAKSGGITVKSGEIIATDSGTNVKFTVTNETGKAVYSLTLESELYGSDGKKIGTVTADYPIGVDPSADITLTAKAGSDCVKAKAVSCSYETGKGRKVSFEIEDGVQAVLTQKDEDGPLTRAVLAEKIIEDMKVKFRKEGFSADGEYDSEKNQLVIATYFRNTYENCLAIYQKDTTPWEKLGSEMASTSKTCLEEFRKYAFNDVSVSVGMLSSDNELMISATDGEIVNMFN